MKITLTLIIVFIHLLIYAQTNEYEQFKKSQEKEYQDYIKLQKVHLNEFKSKNNKDFEEYKEEQATILNDYKRELVELKSSLSESNAALDAIDIELEEEIEYQRVVENITSLVPRKVKIKSEMPTTENIKLTEKEEVTIKHREGLSSYPDLFPLATDKYFITSEFGMRNHPIIKKRYYIREWILVYQREWIF